MNEDNKIEYDKNGNPIQRFSNGVINENELFMDSMEEYEEKSVMVDYADFYRFMDNCPSVYATSADNEKYGSDRLKARKFFARPAMVERCLEAGIRDQGFNRDIVPLIPIVEYKLVPTGYVEYFDPRLTPEERQEERLKKNELEKKRKKTWLHKKSIWEKREEEVREIRAEYGRRAGLNNRKNKKEGDDTDGKK